jgi:hypothetical protein
MNVEIGTEAEPFLIWEYINRIFIAVFPSSKGAPPCIPTDVSPNIFSWTMCPLDDVSLGRCVLVRAFPYWGEAEFMLG